MNADLLGPHRETDEGLKIGSTGFTGRCKPGRSLTIEIEGRETQTAESWRLDGNADRATDFDKKRFSHHHHPYRATGVGESVKVPVTQKVDTIRSIKSRSNIKLESLILAQNERWRQA